MSDTITLDDPQAAAQRIAEVLSEGGLVVLPADTVYTVVADAFAGPATQRLFTAKHRGRNLPLSLLLRNPRQVIGLARDIPEVAERLMAAYWPGPLSLLLPVQPDMPWDLGLNGEAVGLRMPADDLLLDVIAEVGPLACSAANRRGDPLPTTAEEARRQLGDAVALYVEGPVLEGPPSTVVDCTRGGAEVLREGAIRTDDIRRVADGELGWGSRPGDEAPAEAEAGDPDDPDREPDADARNDRDADDPDDDEPDVAGPDDLDDDLEADAGAAAVVPSKGEPG